MVTALPHIWNAAPLLSNVMTLELFQMLVERIWLLICKSILAQVVLSSLFNNKLLLSMKY